MRIFVAGPWGDYAGIPPETIMSNIRTADSIGQQLVQLGHQVYIPHTMCKTWSGLFTQEEMWELDKSFLDNWAQAIYRIPGPSRGSDKEVEYARSLGLTVLSNLERAGKW